MYFYNSWDEQYKLPFGALRRTQNCDFTIRLPEEMPLDYPPVLVVFRTGFKERFLPMNLAQQEEGYRLYTVSFRPMHAGIHYYYFAYTSGGVRHFIKRGDTCHGVLDWGEMFQLTVYARRYQTPDFLKGGIIYQIFPDRFCNSGTPKSDVPTDRVMRQWGELPYYKPDQNGHVWNNDYFGGDLKGIEEKLDYIASLGVTCIYLNPIFEAHENHRYNTANYMKIDPLLGTEEDFRSLCAEAKKRGISIILDGVFSHTGADSIYFNKFGRYDTVGAWQSESSPYYRWYTFHENKTYDAWWGIDTLPNVQENDPTYTEYICGKNGVLQHWLSLGAAGYRLDVADELPEEFLVNLRTSVKSSDPEHIVIGEVWEDASNKEAYGVKRRYLLGDELDSVMNYPFREAIIDYVNGEESTAFRDRIMTILENYPKCTVDVLMNFVSTHDIERAINRFGARRCDNLSKDEMAAYELSPEEYALGKSKLRCALVLMFFLPGVPSIYYGDEVGLTGWKDPFNRRCFPWDKQDEELLTFTRTLGSIRRNHELFAEGRIDFLILEQKVIGFARYDEQTGQSALVFVNRSPEVNLVSLRDKVFQPYAISTVICGICEDDAVILPGYSYAVLSAVKRRTDTDS